MPRLNSSPLDQLSLTSSSRAQIDVGYNKFDQASSLKLIAAMKGKSMVSINMVMCKLGVEGAKAMAEMASVMGSLTKVLVRGNELGDRGTTILCDALRESTVSKVEELDLSWNWIGPNGAKAIAALCAVRPSLEGAVQVVTTCTADATTANPPGDGCVAAVSVPLAALTHGSAEGWGA